MEVVDFVVGVWLMSGEGGREGGVDRVERRGDDYESWSWCERVK